MRQKIARLLDEVCRMAEFMWLSRLSGKVAVALGKGMAEAMVTECHL